MVCGRYAAQDRRSLNALSASLCPAFASLQDLIQVDKQTNRKEQNGMSVNDQQMLDTDQPVPPSPVLADPAPPAAQPDTTPVAHSDYGSLRVVVVVVVVVVE